jgi:UDP-N-acetylglucosamine 2-epimerase
MVDRKLKVMTVVGTRPEIIRLALVIKKLDNSAAIEHILVHTGQNYDYELNEIFFTDLEVRKPDYFLNAAGVNAAKTIGLVISNMDDILEKEKPDAFLLLGDTNSALCTIPAKKRHIPIFHMEAGNRSFDQRVPEEINRKIVDHISDINMPYSDIGREALLREGVPPDRVIKTGSPMYEVLEAYREKMYKSLILQKLQLEEGNYFVVSSHREENIGSEENFNNLCKILNMIAEKFSLPVIVTTHPRTRKMIDSKNIKFNSLVKLEKPFALSDYLALQVNARAVLSDSGTISEESSILGFQALNIREAHERPEAMEEAAVMMTGLNHERIIQCLMQLETEQSSQASFRTAHDYTMPNVSDKVVRIILSYTDYINRVVWKKH